MSAFLNILPEPAFEDLKPALANRLGRLAAGIHAPHLASLLDPMMRQVLQRGFSDAGAHEGTVWLLDQANENLVPAFNTGAQAEQFVGKFKQPLNAGLICMVFANEQPFIENQVSKNVRQSKLLDSLLKTETYAMIAVPFYLLRECRGVVSCVQLKRPGSSEPDPAGFTTAHLASVEFAASLLSQLIEFRLLARVTGWRSE